MSTLSPASNKPSRFRAFVFPEDARTIGDLVYYMAHRRNRPIRRAHDYLAAWSHILENAGETCQAEDYPLAKITSDLVRRYARRERQVVNVDVTSAILSHTFDQANRNIWKATRLFYIPWPPRGIVLEELSAKSKILSFMLAPRTQEALMAIRTKMPAGPSRKTYWQRGLMRRGLWQNIPRRRPPTRRWRRFSDRLKAGPGPISTEVARRLQWRFEDGEVPCAECGVWLMLRSGTQPLCDACNYGSNRSLEQRMHSLGMDCVKWMALPIGHRIGAGTFRRWMSEVTS
jgi:hypothetical protein